MSINNKLLAILIPIVSLTIASLWFIEKGISDQAFSNLEERQMSQSASRVSSQLDDNLTNIENSTKDWGIWTEAYRYIQGNNPDFIRNQVSSSTLSNLDLDVLILLNNKKEVVYQMGRDNPSDPIDKISDGQLQTITRSVLNSLNRSKNIVTLNNNQILLAASSPILQNEGIGPEIGTIIMGRYINDAVLTSIKDATVFPVSISVDSGHALSPNFKPTTLPGIWADRSNARRLDVFYRLKDSSGAEKIAVTINQGRDEAAIGRVLVGSIASSLLAFASLFILLLSLSLKAIFLNRLNKMTAKLAIFKKSNNPDDLPLFAGSDEISLLARETKNNLTNLKLLEDTALENSQQLNSVINSFYDAAYILNHENKIEKIYQAPSTIVALFPAKAQGKSIDSFLAQHQLTAEFNKALEECRRQDKVVNLELNLNNNSGDRRFVAKISTRKDAKGKFKGFIVITRDITNERRLAREYRALFEKMLNSFALHEMVFDDNGQPIDYRFLAVNPAMEQTLGLEAKKIIGHTVRELIPSIESFWIKTYAKVVQTGESVHFENYSLAMGKYFEVTAFHLEGNQFATLSQDITEIRLNEQKLHQGQLLLLKYIENAPLAILEVDKRGQFNLVNQAACTMLGYTREELLKLSTKDVTHPDDLNLTSVSLKKIDQSGKDNLECRLIKKDRQAIWVAINSVKVEDDRFLSFMRDITADRLAAEELLKRNKELENFYELAISRELKMVELKKRLKELNAPEEDNVTPA